MISEIFIIRNAECHKELLHFLQICHYMCEGNQSPEPVSSREIKRISIYWSELLTFFAEELCDWIKHAIKFLYFILGKNLGEYQQFLKKPKNNNWKKARLLPTLWLVQVVTCNWRSMKLLGNGSIQKPKFLFRHIFYFFVNNLNHKLNVI